MPLSELELPPVLHGASDLGGARALPAGSENIRRGSSECKRDSPQSSEEFGSIVVTSTPLFGSSIIDCRGVDWADRDRCSTKAACMVTAAASRRARCKTRCGPDDAERAIDPPSNAAVKRMSSLPCGCLADAANLRPLSCSGCQGTARAPALHAAMPTAAACAPMATTATCVAVPKPSHYLKQLRVHWQLAET